MSHTPSLDRAPSTALRPCISISGAIAYSFYTLSSPHRYRLKHLAVIFLLSADYFQRSYDLYPDNHINQVFAHGVLIWLLHLVHVIILRRDDGYIASNSGQSKNSPDGVSSLSKIGLSSYYRAYKMLFNFRGIGTSWQAVTTQRRLFPAQQQDGSRLQLDINQCTSCGKQDKDIREAFSQIFDLIRRLFSIICRFLALAVLYEITESGTRIWSQAPFLGGTRYLSVTSYKPGQARLSTTEITARAYLTLYFIFHDCLLLSSFHEGLSIIHIYILRLDDPHEWPPLFGNISKAYTVRRFWGNFWHRLVYAPFRALADALSTQVSGSKRRNVCRRLINNALVFLLSGILHSMIDFGKGSCNPSASGIFYFSQPVGFILESLVQSAWAPLRKRLSSGGSKAVLTMLAIFETILGYGWVWTWFFWLLPYRMISELQCRRQGMEYQS